MKHFHLQEVYIMNNILKLYIIIKIIYTIIKFIVKASLISCLNANGTRVHTLCSMEEGNE